MSRAHRASFLTLMAAASLAISPPSTAQEKLQGKVTSTKMTGCNYPSGGCEGWMTLQTDGASKEEVKILVKSATVIKKGAETVYLPALRGNVVAVTLVQEQGERLAKAIEIQPKK